MDPIKNTSDYQPFEGNDLDEIRFPKLTADQVTDHAEIILNKQRHSLRGL